MSSQALPSADGRGRVNGRPVLTSIGMLHIRWKVFGLLSESIEIAHDARDPSSVCRPYTSTDSLVRKPATEPPVSSLQVEVDGPRESVSYFLRGHYEDGAEDAEWVRAPTPTDEELVRARDGMFRWGDDGQGNVLVRGCSVQRPQVPPMVTITASEHPYVTIGDYVDTVHAWLRTYRDDILYARSFWTNGALPADTTLYVRVLRPIKVHLMDSAQEAGKSVASYTRGAAARESVERYMRERNAGIDGS
ncbi:hypothetical protein K461DRAFT_283176 [Myriangium duriaei CBS 260.36]|uniref:Uncharacterized protein n=1 Tax=Myriangium duriaei CBS 260.36 TaxID=1168546 RepID=A0A9P4IQ98_9PEZI|nr:hypothetical protein K461DRAFT_283176 [Myriangium duriaei CBS 260.36]